MRILTIILVMAIIISTIAYSAKPKSQYTTKDKVAAENAFYLASVTFWSWWVEQADMDGKHVVENQYPKLDKLIGPKGVNFILIVPEIKMVNKKKVCVTKTVNHRISSKTLHENIIRQYEIVRAINLNKDPPAQLDDLESVLLRKYIINYAIGYPIDEGDSSSHIDLPVRKSISEWSWSSLNFLPDNIPKPTPRPLQKIKFIKNGDIWQIDEIQTFIMSVVNKDVIIN